MTKEEMKYELNMLRYDFNELYKITKHMEWKDVVKLINEISMKKNNKKLIVYEGCKGRGSEVIRELESLGGLNKYNHIGNNEHYYYYINKDCNIVAVEKISMPFTEFCEIRKLRDLPKTLFDMYKIIYPWRSISKKEITTLHWFVKLELLKRLMCIYNENWKPSWEYNHQDKYCIVLKQHFLYIQGHWSEHQIFVFKNYELAKIFLDKFKEELTEVLTELTNNLWK